MSNAEGQGPEDPSNRLFDDLPGDLPGHPSDRLPGDPPDDAAAKPKLPWYRRGRVLVGVVVVVFIAASVLSDLPGNQSQASAATSYLTALKSYDASCAGALNEAFTLESLVLRHRATAVQRSLVPGLLRDDLNACSYTNQDLSDMQSNLQPPGFASGHQLGLVNSCVVQWEFPDANEVISALTKLLGPPTDPSAVAALEYWDGRLAIDNARAAAHLAMAAADAKASLGGLGLPTPPEVSLPAGGGGGYTPPVEGPNPCLKP